MPLPLGHLENLIESNESPPPGNSPNGSVSTDGLVFLSIYPSAINVP